MGPEGDGIFNEENVLSSKAIGTSIGKKLQMHPLSPHWTFWVWKSDPDLPSWSDSLHEQFTITSLEQFWALQHRLVEPSQLNSGVDYMYFKKGIKPMWEDPKNTNGAMFCVDVERQYKHIKLDRFWLELLIAIMGGQFDEHNTYINGAICNIRSRGEKICLWVSEVFAPTSPERKAIKEVIDAKLGLSTTDRLYFTKHRKY